jgi:predicted RNA-binding protein
MLAQQIVSENMPKEMFEDALAEALQQSLDNFKIEPYAVREFMQERIKARAIELLNTTYRDEIDKIANRVVAAGFAAQSGRRD